jgi:predicted aspartyl protease
VRDVLARYLAAVSDAGTGDVTRFEAFGTLSGAGLGGAFHTWLQGERERTDQNLGPRVERTLRVGDREWFAGSDGDVREFTGLLLRRARTERFIDSGDFAKHPERCELRERTVVTGRPAFALDVSAERGEVETVYLDVATSLIDRIAYDDDDGRATIDFSDWRDVEGHRFPFRVVASDGDHAYDTVQETTLVDVHPTIDPAVFAPLVPRYIDMAGPETVPLDVRDGHLFVTVRIAGRSYVFLLDSGAQNIVIDKRVAAQLGLPAVGALEASGATRTGGLQIAPVAELDVGTGRLRDFVATTLDLGSSTSGAFRIDGILGFPFFASALVKLDPAHRTMTLGPPGSFAPPGEAVPLEVDRAFPEADVRVAGTLGHFIIDTGNAAELLLYRRFVDKHAGIVPYSQNGRTSYGIGGTTTSYRSSLDRLSVGSFTLYHVETDVMLATSGAFADRFDAGNLGFGILRNFVATFDVGHAALYLERGADFDDGRSRM